MHTPGPWVAKRDDNREEYEIGVPRADGVMRLVATVSFGYSEPAETEQHANAALIAAAPDLLKTLRRIADEDFVYSSDDDEETQLSLRIADARAALVKISR